MLQIKKKSVSPLKWYCMLDLVTFTSPCLQLIADEFSHTVMHGQKLARELPPPPRVSKPPARMKFTITDFTGNQNKLFYLFSNFCILYAKNIFFVFSPQQGRPRQLNLSRSTTLPVYMEHQQLGSPRKKSKIFNDKYNTNN